MADSVLETHLDGYGSARTLFVTGELDVATADTLERAVDGAIDGQGGEFRLDVSGLTFMDSTGARAVMHAYNKAVSLGSRLIVLYPTRALRRVLDLMGLDRVLDIKDGTPPRSKTSTDIPS